MNNIQEALNRIKKLDDAEKHFLIFRLLKDKDIDFVSLSVIYSKYLETLNEKNEREKNLIAGCLSSKYNEYDDMEFINARSSILLYPYVSNEFIKSNVLQGASKKAIDKEKKFLKEELKI